MNVDNIFLRILIVAGYLYASSWSFNHINAWVGIGMFVLGLYIAVKLLFKNKKD